MPVPGELPGKALDLPPTCHEFGTNCMETLENQRVPYPNEMLRNLRTEYATVRHSFTREFGSSLLGATSLPLSLV